MAKGTEEAPGAVVNRGDDAQPSRLLPTLVSASTAKPPSPELDPLIFALICEVAPGIAREWHSAGATKIRIR